MLPGVARGDVDTAQKSESCSPLCLYAFRGTSGCRTSVNTKQAALGEATEELALRSSV